MRRALRLAILSGLLLSVAAAQPSDTKPLKSGPQAGQEIPGPFHVYNVTGLAKSRDHFHCLVCDYGLDPVIMVFVHTKGLEQEKVTVQEEISDQFASLVGGLDRACLVNSRKNLRAFVVFLDDDLPDVIGGDDQNDDRREAIKKRILAFADEAASKNGARPGLPDVPLCMDSPNDPVLTKQDPTVGYALNPQAALTVVLYNSHRVIANYAYRKGALKEADVKEILEKGVSKLLAAH